MGDCGERAWNEGRVGRWKVVDILGIKEEGFIRGN